MKDLDQFEAELRDQPKPEKEKPQKSEFLFCAVWCSAFKACKVGPCPHGLPEGLVKRNE